MQNLFQMVKKFVKMQICSFGIGCWMRWVIANKKFMRLNLILNLQNLIFFHEKEFVSLQFCYVNVNMYWSHFREKEIRIPRFRIRCSISWTGLSDCAVRNSVFPAVISTVYGINAKLIGNLVIQFDFISNL